MNNFQNGVIVMFTLEKELGCCSWVVVGLLFLGYYCWVVTNFADAFCYALPVVSVPGEYVVKHKVSAPLLLAITKSSFPSPVL